MSRYDHRELHYTAEQRDIMAMNRLSPKQSAKIGRPWLLILFALFSSLITACGIDRGSRLVQRDGNSSDLLPTPTLALPINVDPLRPPTPMLTPAPTLLGEQIAETQVEIPADPTKAPPKALPTDAPLPEDATARELLDLGRTSATEGNQMTAYAAFKAALKEPADLTEDEQAEAHLGLAVALLSEGHDAAAESELTALIASRSTSVALTKGNELPAPINVVDAAMFHLGRVRLIAGDYRGAIESFTDYLNNNPDMAAYVQPFIADAYEALGDADSVITALEAATGAHAQRFKAVANRMRLASLYVAREEYASAIAQYDAIHDIARTEATKGQVIYLAGQAEIMAGNTDAGHERLLRGVMNYPRAAESYYGLIALLEAEIAVDEYQRGLVDYYAGAYIPAIEAFGRTIADGGNDFKPDAHLYVAWSQEALGNHEAAITAIDVFAKYEPARALFERGEIFRRSGQVDKALAAYDEFLTGHAEAESAASVAWIAATLADAGDLPDAASRYLALADAFPFDDNTPSALARAAELLEQGNPDEALVLRKRLAEQYPANVYGAEALFRLLQAAAKSQSDDLDKQFLREQVGGLPLSNYFALRATDFVAGNDSFSADGEMTLPIDPEEGRAEAEDWLRERLPTSDNALSEGNLGALSDELAADPQRIVGEKLWQLGLLEEAKAELETLREANAGDALANYQLARYFSRLGLYRSSIIAAATLLHQTGATAFDSPVYLGRLSFPVYYADLIMPLADQHGFDPRLQFALVRQESLFESFARSGAAAQGLSQVIPDTGAWIAQRLAWPNFENEDLYKPYVGLNFGAYYLSQQLEYFDGFVTAALAAYNAGPGNALRWFETAGTDHDLFVDVVNFPETRLYIERIYEGFNAYRHLYRSP